MGATATNPNENCLEGMSCPKCGSFGPFRIAVSTWAIVHDDGTEHDGDTEWEEDSSCYCREEDCGHGGTVKEFQEEGREPALETAPEPLGGELA